MTAPDFNAPIDRRGTHCAKWDALESLYNIDPADGIAMWVADMEFKPPQAVLDALHGMVDHGVFGYYGNQSSYKNAICGWMERRHNWTVNPSWIFTAHGLVNGTALCVQTWTKPGDGVILFTPVYHAFSRVIAANDRRVVEAVMPIVDGRYELDLDALEAKLDGSERMIVFCSPHNPGGRVWSRDELQALCDFARKHDLILVSDEIHHDLVYDGAQHTVMALVDETVKDRLVVMTAASKTFNMAGAHVGTVIIEDEKLRSQFQTTLAAGGNSPNSFGLVMVEAAYTKGDEWLDALLGYLAENKRIFDDAINAIPGLSSMRLESTYLAWVDFSGTGMERMEIVRRLEEDAKIATNHGPTFGTGGEMFQRFNLGCPRAQLNEAIARIQSAFGDLQ